MKIGAAYIRVSTDDQLEYSPDSQMERINQYAAAHDIRIDRQHIYIDEGISGRNTKKRDAFQEMIACAKQSPRPFDVILVWKFSRFARNQEEAILYKNMLRKKLGVDVVSVSEPLMDGPFGQLIERIIEWSDEYYSINLGDEVRRGMTQKAKNGGQQAGAPYGYTKKKGEAMVLCKDEADTVRFIFRSYLDGGTFFSISRELNESGRRTKRGNLFDSRQIEYILNNPVYKGDVRWTPQKTVSKRIYDSPETIIVKGTHEAIIDEETWNFAHRKYAAEKSHRQRNNRPSESRRHYLSGILKCGSCGASLVYSKASRGFQCYKYAHGQCAASHYISGQKIEKAVMDALHWLSKPGTYSKTVSCGTEVRKIISVKEREILRLEEMLRRARDAYLAGSDTLDEYSVSKHGILAQIDQLRADIESEKSAPASQEESKRQVSDLIDFLESDASTATKNAALTQVVDRIVFSRENGMVSIFFYG